MVWVKLRAVAAASEGQRLAAVGNLCCFGNWEPGCALRFRKVDEMMFEAVVDIPESELRDLTYKYILVARDEPGRACWEDGPNRSIQSETGQEVVIKEDSLVTSIFGSGIKFKTGTTDFTAEESHANADIPRSGSARSMRGDLGAKGKHRFLPGLHVDEELLKRTAAVGAVVVGVAIVLFGLLRSGKSRDGEEKPKRERADNKTIIDAFRNLLSGRRSVHSINSQP